MFTELSTLPKEYQDIYNRLLMPVDTNIKLSDVILSDANKSKVELFLKELKHKDELLKYGLYPLNRILMYGASGTGKTFLTKALSNHIKYDLLYIDIAKALSDESVANNMSDIFKFANYTKRCIVFLDECDSITMSRYNSNYSDSAVVRRATNSLFQQLDQMDPSVVFVAATNLLFKIDPAFERRINLKMEFRRPEMNMKEVIRKFIKPGFVVEDDVDMTFESIIDRRAGQYAKLSYYELEGLVQRAMKDAIIDGRHSIKTSRIYKDLADAMGVKHRFRTADDDAEIFEHPTDGF